MTTEQKLDGKTFDFMSALTAVVVIAYIGPTAWGYLTGSITWEQFSSTVGDPALLLLGFWVRGAVK